MGTTLSVTPWCRPESAVDVFLRLARRVLHGGKLHRLLTHPSQPEKDQHHLDPNSEQTRQFICDLAESRTILTVVCSLPLARGEWINLDLDFRGRRAGTGKHVPEEGYFSTSVSLNDVTRPLQNAGEPGYPPEEQAVRIVLDDAEQLFLLVCGRSEGERDPDVRYGAMYYESGLPTAESCYMVMHDDVAEFARDVTRSYAAYQWGLATAPMLEKGVDLLELHRDKGVPRGETGREWLQERRAWMFRWHPDLVRLQEECTEQDARRLSQLSREACTTILQDICTTGGLARFRQFDDGAAALIADPTKDLAPIYRQLVHLTRPGERYEHLVSD